MSKGSASDKDRDSSSKASSSAEDGNSCCGGGGVHGGGVYVGESDEAIALELSWLQMEP